MRALENRVPPPLLMLGVGATMALSLLGSSPGMMSTAERWGLAAAFFIAAGAFGLPAFVAFGKAKTTIDPVKVERASTLVITGVYRFTRNPMYVALSLLLCAWAAWLDRPLPCIGPVAFALFVTRFQIVPEERALTAKFGNAFLTYCHAVRRWL